MSAALAVALGLVYAPSFTMDFLTNDEAALVGRDWRDYPFKVMGLAHGRPLSVYRPFVYELVGYSPGRIQLVRFLSFAGLTAIAILLMRFLRRESGRPWFSFLTILFLYSQLPFQLISGFSLDLVSFVLPTILLSLAAFWLHFYVFPERGTGAWIARGAVFLLLFAAIHSSQSWAFFAMAPVAFLALAGNRERLPQVRAFLLLAAAALIIAVPLFLAGLRVLAAEGRQGYEMAEGALEVAGTSPLQLVVHTLDPRTYWSAFKLWTHPFPFHTLRASEPRRFAMAMVVLVLWLGLVGAAIARETRRRPAAKGPLAARWLAALACMGFGAFVMVAASPVWVRELRPHLTLVLSSCAIFIAAYALLVLAERYPTLGRAPVTGLAAALVLATAFGAQTNLLRGYVDPRGDELDFIRTELAARQPSDFDRVVVILPSRKAFCISEPCDPYTGRVTLSLWHARAPERYRYAMSTLGLDPAATPVLFVEGPVDSRKRDLLIDWRKYYRARKRYAVFGLD
jgi:hypothetical protein